MRINHNIPALFAYNAYSTTLGNLGKVIQKLSTGLRINSAADDAAGLAISEKMRSQIRGLNQALRNVQDGISMIQTADGALEQSQSILQRIRELSVQAANDVLTMNDREYIQLEIDQLKEELNRIANTTQFNGKLLLNGNSDAIWSADTNGVWVNVKGGLSSRDQFAQIAETDGNYKITLKTIEAGQNQVLKSSIFRMKEDSIVASKNAQLQDIMNFVGKNGLHLLESPQTISVSFDGIGSASFTVYKEDTLGELGEKLAAAIWQASGLPPDGSPVQFVGEDVKVPGRNDPVANALASNYLRNAADRIKQFYNLDGNGKTIAMAWMNTNPGEEWDWIYNGGGPEACVDGAYPYAYTGIFFNPDFFIVQPINEGKIENYDILNTLTAHEMVHTSTRAYEGISAVLSQSYAFGAWLEEGLADYIASGNNKTVAFAKGNASYLSDVKGKIDLLMDPATAWADYWNAPPGSAADVAKFYVGGYLAVRYFDQQSIANGGTGILGLLEELKITGGTDGGTGAAIDTAIFNASNGLFSGLSDLRTVLTDGTADDFLLAVANEDPNVDTGAIGGFYASGGPKLNRHSVIPKSDNYEINPLKDYGWTSINWSPFGDMGSSLALPSSTAQDNSLQSVEGTLLLHSPIAGAAGRMTLSGDEEFLQALGFAEVQAAKETVYSVTITDAHSGKLLSSGSSISGNRIVGLLHENLDIYFGANFALNIDGSGTWFNGYGSYRFLSGSLDFIVHIASNSTAFQTGANEGEFLNVSFGDTGSKALGIDRLSVLNRELAARAITIADDAIRIVSMKRARLGAYQNRLEHNVANLMTTETNLTDAESRIRDADMSKEMLNFTRLQILLQSGTAMMTQANQIPQAVLSLMR